MTWAPANLSRLPWSTSWRHPRTLMKSQGAARAMTENAISARSFASDVEHGIRDQHKQKQPLKSCLLSNDSSISIRELAALRLTDIQRRLRLRRAPPSSGMFLV